MDTLNHHHPKSEIDVTQCRIVEIADGKIVECLVQQPSCNYTLYFGNSIFCVHPLRQEIVRQQRMKGSV